MLPKRFVIIGAWSSKVKGPIIADIGTDHGKLARYLAGLNVKSKVLAIDLRPHIVAQQQDNALNAKYPNLRFFVSNGLENCPFQVDLAICAGMGARTILAILKQPQKAAGYILQLRNNPEAIRKWWNEQGYFYLEDTIIYDNKHYYHTLFLHRHRGKKFNQTSLRFGDYKTLTPVVINYWTRKVQELEKIAAALPKQQRQALYTTQILPIKNIILK